MDQARNRSANSQLAECSVEGKLLNFAKVKHMMFRMRIFENQLFLHREKQLNVNRYFGTLHQQDVYEVAQRVSILVLLKLLRLSSFDLQEARKPLRFQAILSRGI